MTDKNVPAVQSAQSSAIVQHGKYSEAEIATIKANHFKNLEDHQISYALTKAERMGLDFFTGDVVCWKGQEGRVEVYTTIAGLRRKAEETQLYFPGRVPTFVIDAQGNIESCTAYVKRWDERTGQWVEIEGVAYWNESAKNSGAWTTHHHSMLAKCAEAFALRRAFASLAGLYINEERDSMVDADQMKAQDRDAARGHARGKLASIKEAQAGAAGAASHTVEPRVVLATVESPPNTGSGGAGSGPVVIETTAERVDAPADTVAQPADDSSDGFAALLAATQALVAKLNIPKKVVLYKKLGMAMDVNLSLLSSSTLRQVHDQAVALAK